MKNKVSKVMLVSVITNICLCLCKTIFGIVFNSASLFSDGIHSFSDLMTDFIAIVGNFLARKPADDEHPYGHGKIEYLTSLLIGLFIVLLSIVLIINSVNRRIIIPSIIVAGISLITIVSKLLLSRYIINKGKKLNNSILVASGKESLADVYSSIIVLLSAILIQFSNYLGFLKYCDIVSSIVVGLFIFKSGMMIIRDNISVVLGAQETDYKYLNQIKKIIKNTDKVVGVSSLVIMKYGHISSLNLVITMDGNTTIKAAHDISDVLETKIKGYSKKIEYINIHIEPSK